MPIETWERQGDSGAFVKLGDASPNGAGSGDAPTPAGSEAPAAAGHGDAPPGQSRETSAPPSDAPDGTPPAQAAPDGTLSGDDDTDEPGDPDAALTVARFNRRMGQVTRYRRQAERELAGERQRNAELAAKVETLTAMISGAAPPMPDAPRQDPSAPPLRPNAADYTDQAAYDQAMDVWLDRRTHHAMRQQSQAEQAQRSLQEREAAFKAQHADYDDVVRTQLAGKTAPHVQQALMLLPEGPALAYALAHQPDTLQRLNQMPPPLMLMELGRLVPASSPPAGTHGTTTPVTNGQATPPLPPPLTPVQGQGVVPTAGLREGMTFEDYKRERQRSSQLPVWKAR